MAYRRDIVRERGVQRRCKRGEGTEPARRLDDTAQPESQYQRQPRQHDEERYQVAVEQPCSPGRGGRTEIERQ